MESLQRKLVFQFVSLYFDFVNEVYTTVCFIIFHLVDPPKITRDPKSQSVATGTHTTLRVQATGDDLQFQWQKDDIDIDSSEPRTQCNSTGNASILHIQHTEKSDKGHYRCLVKNPIEKMGKASQEANLTVCKFLILLCAI